MYTAFLLLLFCALQMSRHVPGDTDLCNKFLGQAMEERTCSTHSYLLLSDDYNTVFISHIFLPGYLTEIQVKVQVFWYVISCFGFRVTEVTK